MPNPTVAVLLHAADARACVAAGAHPWFGVRHYASFDELLETLRTEDVPLVVIDAADARCRSMASAIATIRQSFPSVPILAYCSFPTGRSSEVVEAVRAGATGLVLRGIDDARSAMRAAIQSARRMCVAQRVQAEVTLHLPPVALPLLQYAVTRAVHEPSVDDAATSLGVDRKTLYNWLRNCGNVSPRAFISWIRLAIVVGMLEDPGRSAEQVALEAGFASGTAFRNMLRRYTGLGCSEIRVQGGLAKVLAHFFSELGPQTERDGPSAIPMPEAEMHAPAQPSGA